MMEGGKLTRFEGLDVYIGHNHLEVGKERSIDICPWWNYRDEAGGFLSVTVRAMKCSKRSLAATERAKGIQSEQSVNQSQFEVWR